MTAAHVYDTSVKITQGLNIHFDVVIQKQALIHVKQCLKSPAFADALIEQHNSIFCHNAEPRQIYAAKSTTEDGVIR